MIDFFTVPIRLRDIARPSTWAQVWSSYSLFDPAYANRKSGGLWVDILINTDSYGFPR